MKRLVALVMRMMGKRTCEEVTAILHDYFESSLDPKLEAIIDRHFHDCPDCKAFAHTYREVVQLTGELPCDEIPEEVRLRVHAALRERFGAAR